MKLTDEQMKHILYYMEKCYEVAKETDFIEEENYIFFPNIEFIRNDEGDWIILQ